MKNPHRALEAIELLVGGDLGLDVEWKITDERLKLDPFWRQVGETFIKIYQIAHSEVARCEHGNWEKIKYEIIKDYDNQKM